MASEFDRERMANFVGDVKNLRRLRSIQDPSQDEIRLHAASMRRLLIENTLQAVASLKRAPVAIMAPDAQPFVRAARNNHVDFYSLGGADVFGMFMFGSTGTKNPNAPNVDADPDARIPLKPESFLKQSIAFVSGHYITRHDILAYVANKAGGVHLDNKASHTLTPEKMRAINTLRQTHSFKKDQSSDSIIINHTIDADSEVFTYRPDEIDIVYFEFICTIQFFIDSLDIQNLTNDLQRELEAAARIR